jgi:hypothetical protein
MKNLLDLIQLENRAARFGGVYFLFYFIRLNASRFVFPNAVFLKTKSCFFLYRIANARKT